MKRQLQTAAFFLINKKSKMHQSPLCGRCGDVQKASPYPLSISRACQKAGRSFMRRHVGLLRICRSPPELRSGCDLMHLKIPDGGSANEGCQSTGFFCRYRVDVCIGAIGLPFHPGSSRRTSTYCSRDLENTNSKSRIWRGAYGVIVGTDVGAYGI